MKARIICFLIATLLITSTTLAIADWELGDGHKMHFPQLPDPNGWDVDFHDWWLGDDWLCTESGEVTDIHFWISFQRDVFMDLPYVDVSIWSNIPGPPSHPGDMLWTYQFMPEDFIIAGPWVGDQGWYWPPDFFEQPDHQEYWQINIPDIEQPFTQQEDTIYWLVIRMPFFVDPFAPPGIGWKTSTEQFEDNAVFGAPGSWNPIWDPISHAPLDFAFVIDGGGPDPICCLNITGVDGGLLSPASSLNVIANITNTGTDTCYDVNWSITFSGLIFLGPANGVLADIPPGDTKQVISKPVIGFGIPGILPSQVTITADCANNVCAPPTVTKDIMVLLFLLSVM
jgi:hypothetical protein